MKVVLAFNSGCSKFNVQDFTDLVLKINAVDLKFFVTYLLTDLPQPKIVEPTTNEQVPLVQFLIFFRF